jgi:integrase
MRVVLEKAPTTAIHVRGYVRRIFARAIANGYRAIGDNPVGRGGPLDELLGPLVGTGNHHASLPYQKIGEFMANELLGYKVRKMTSLIIVQLLRFTILTAVRVGQAREMRWSEVDWENRIWVCRPERHKSGKKTQTDYIVPLSEQAIELLKKMRAMQIEAGVYHPELFVFVRNLPHSSTTRDPKRMGATLLEQRRRRQLAKSAIPLGPTSAVFFLQYTLHRRDITVHGFRTTFGDWSVDSGYDERDSEMALGHKVGNNVRNIYKRHAQRIEPRRPMMQAWADFVDRSAEVIPFREAK